MLYKVEYFFYHLVIKINLLKLLIPKIKLIYISTFSLKILEKLFNFFIKLKIDEVYLSFNMFIGINPWTIKF